MKYVFYLAFFATSTSFGQKTYDIKFSPRIQSMLDSSLVLIKSNKQEQALSLYDQIILLDSADIRLYELKVSWEVYLKSYDRALKTSISMTSLAPNNPTYQIRTASFYERLGDSVNARPYFAETLRLCNSILDTLKNADPLESSMYKVYKAIATIFYGDEVLGNKLLFDIYKEQGEDPNIGGVYPFLNKSKPELLKAWLDEK